MTGIQINTRVSPDISKKLILPIKSYLEKTIHRDFSIEPLNLKTKISNFSTRAFVSVLILTPASVFAQSPPDSGALLERQKQQESIQRPSLPAPEAQVEKKTVKADTNQLRILLKKFVYQGTFQQFKRADFDRILASYVGQQVSLQDLQEAVAKITNLYHSKGYFLARALLPPQDVTEGIIQIRIIEGRLENSDESLQINDIDQSLRLEKHFVKKVAGHALTPGQAITKSELERTVLILSDLPGLKATANLEPGDQPGTARIIFDVNEGKQFVPWVQVDNHGDRLTGRGQVSASFAFNDINGYGDKFTLYGKRSIGDGDSQYLSLGYRHPIAYSGMTAGLSYRHLSYEYGKEFKALDMRGKADSLFADVRYPIIRSRESNLYVDASLEHKSLEDKALSQAISKKKNWRLSSSVSGDHADRLWGGGYTSAKLTASFGETDLSDSASFESDQSSTGPGTHGSFQKLNYNLSRLHRGGANIFFRAGLRGQQAFSNLASGEKFQLGGVHAIRAYPNGEGSGDHGHLLNLEGFYTLKTDTDIGNIKLLGFYDWGWIQRYKNDRGLTLDTPSSYNLKGYGVGLNIERTNIYDFYLTWARRIGDNPGANSSSGKDSDGSKEKNRIWFSFQAKF